MKHFVFGLLALTVTAFAALADTSKCLVAGKYVYTDGQCPSGTAVLWKSPSLVIASAPKYREQAVSVPLRMSQAAMNQQVPASLPVFRKSPKSPTITIYYNPTGEPFSIEDDIRYAADLWSESCNVNLKYGGQTKDFSSGYVISWQKELYSDALGIAAAGHAFGRSLNIELSAKDVDQKSARHTIAHELGHTLGIGHIHDDPKSIMSYLADYDTWIAAILSPSDKVACNDAIKSRYGIDYERPQTIQTSKMTDKEAMEIMRQRQSN